MSTPLQGCPLCAGDLWFSYTARRAWCSSCSRWWPDVEDEAGSVMAQLEVLECELLEEIRCLPWWRPRRQCTLWTKRALERVRGLLGPVD